jgi:predicted ester cyclase
MSLDVAADVRALYESLAAGEYEKAAESIPDEVLLLNVATGDVYRGRTGFLAYVRGWSAAFPDLRRTLVKVAGAGDRAVAEYELAGNHNGPLVTPRGHVPPTGMDVQLRFCDVLEYGDEGLSHIRSYFDSSTLLRQLGLVSGSPLHAPDRRAPLELYAQAVDGNAPERNKAIVSRFFQDVLNRQNPHAAVDTCSRDYQWHGGTLGEAKGLKAYQAVLAGLFAAFPDLEVQVLESTAEADRVAVRFATSGTHLGEFQGIPPTFKRVAAGGMSTFRIEESRIVEEWWQGDVLLMLQQMDAAPQKLRLSR